jgi:hypothetical protein
VARLGRDGRLRSRRPVRSWRRGDQEHPHEPAG